MTWWRGSEKVAVGLGPERLRLTVARGNGTLRPIFDGAAALPEGALRAGLRRPSITDHEAVGGALRGLVDEARAARALRRSPELTAIVVPDVTVKLAAAPIEGSTPGRAEGAEIARWLLQEALPIEPTETRIDWTIARDEGADGDGAADWLIGLGAARALIREYEEVVESVGLQVGRVLPWTLAAAGAGRGRDDGDPGRAREFRRLILCAGDGVLAALVVANDVPRFHRAWRARVQADELERELPFVQRFVADRLEMTLGDVLACGDSDWAETAVAVSDSLGIRAMTVRPSDALLGALAT